MLSKRLVTAICPTFSRPRFVEQAVKLFLRQRWTDSELLIFDDSPKALQTAVKDAPRIKVVRLGQRVSMGEKLNMGLDRAQGDFVAHWDDDDWQAPVRLLRQVETLVLEPVDVCGYAIQYLMTTGNARFWRFDRSFIPRKEFVGNSMIKVGVPFMDGTALFRRSVVGTIRYPSIAVSQKVQFLHDLWKKAGARLKSLPNEGMYVYVRHHEQSSAVNTWQYLRDRRLLPIEQPSWFPTSELEFYRRVA